MLTFSIRFFPTYFVDDDAEAAPAYRGDDKVGQPVIRPHKNHDLCMKWEPTQMES